MSILNKLKAVNTRKSSRLFEVHPLANASFEFRLQYLAALAFAIAVEREPNANELTAFNELAKTLAVEETDAKEQLSERSQLSGEDIETLLNAIKANNAASFYLLDVLWIHNIDGDCEEHETTVSNELAAFFEINENQVETLRALTQAIQNKTLGKNLPVVAKAWEFEELRNPLTPTISKLLPFRAIIDNRWIEHDDDTATDMNTGLTWFRRDVIEATKNISQSIRYNWVTPFGKSPTTCSGFEIEKLISSLNLDKNWRLPEKEEFDKSLPFPSPLFDFNETVAYPYTNLIEENKFVLYNNRTCELEAVILCKEADF